MNKLLLAASISILSAGAMAENYQTEANVTYVDNDNANGLVVGLNYHFDVVDTNNKPLKEAAFLDRSNNIGIGYSAVGDNDVAFVNAEFYLNHFYIAPSYSNPDVGDSSFAAKVGYIGNDLRITTVIPEEDYEFNIDVKYVTALAGDNFINLEAGFSDGGDNADDTAFVSGDYYFDDTFSVGAVITNTDDTDFGFRVNKFFTGKFSAGASFTARDNDDTFALNAAFRF